MPQINGEVTGRTKGCSHIKTVSFTNVSLYSAMPPRNVAWGNVLQILSTTDMIGKKKLRIPFRNIQTKEMALYKVNPSLFEEHNTSSAFFFTNCPTELLTCLLCIQYSMRENFPTQHKHQINW